MKKIFSLSMLIVGSLLLSCEGNYSNGNGPGPTNDGIGLGGFTLSSNFEKRCLPDFNPSGTTGRALDRSMPKSTFSSMKIITDSLVHANETVTITGENGEKTEVTVQEDGEFEVACSALEGITFPATLTLSGAELYSTVVEAFPTEACADDASAEQIELSKIFRNINELTTLIHEEYENNGNNLSEAKVKVMVRVFGKADDDGDIPNIPAESFTTTKSKESGNTLSEILQIAALNSNNNLCNAGENPYVPILAKDSFVDQLANAIRAGELNNRTEILDEITENGGSRDVKDQFTRIAKASEIAIEDEKNSLKVLILGKAEPPTCAQGENNTCLAPDVDPDDIPAHFLSNEEDSVKLNIRYVFERQDALKLSVTATDKDSNEVPLKVVRGTVVNKLTYGEETITVHFVNKLSMEDISYDLKITMNDYVIAETTKYTTVTFRTVQP